MRDSESEFIRTRACERSCLSLGADKRELVSARPGKHPRAGEPHPIPLPALA
jgi:hypothetical protein